MSVIDDCRPCIINTDVAAIRGQRVPQGVPVALVAGISLAFSFAVFGQGSPSPAAPGSTLGREWSTIRRETVGTTSVIRELSRPYPDSATANTSQIDAVDAQSIALGFLRAHGEQLLKPLALPTNPTNSLVVTQVVSSVNTSEYRSRGKIFTVVYAQKHGGIPVFESAIRVRITRDGQVWSVFNDLARVDAGTPTKPRLTAVDALSRARQDLRDSTAVPDADPSLYVMAPSRLAWRFNFLRPHFKEMMVDATSGEILLQRRNVVQ